jgi:uncharacterized repeat protein (TIGR03833 family)
MLEANIMSSRGMVMMNGTERSAIRPGLQVDIVLKQDQRTGKLTRGVVKDILTNAPKHPHGIKVRLADGQVGRVKNILA